MSPGPSPSAFGLISAGRTDRRGAGGGRMGSRGMRWSGVCTVAESSETVAGLRDAAMISLMSDCLLRISEAVAVDVEDIGEEGLQIHRGERSDILYICERTRRLINAIVGSLGLLQARCSDGYASRIM